MSFSDRTGKEVHHLEGLIDDLSWGFEFHETFYLKQGITFKLDNAGQLGKIHAHAAGRNPAGSWGEPCLLCPIPGIGVRPHKHKPSI